MTLYNEIDKRLKQGAPVNIVISGVSCSGKTTLANALKKHYLFFYSVAGIAQDDYFKNLCDVPKTAFGYLMDSIEAFHADEYREDVNKLIKRRIAVIPNYEILSNKRISKDKLVRAGRLNIFEGLHTIELLKELPDAIRIFVDTDIDECIRRRIIRDTSMLDVSEARIREYWNDCIRPMNMKYILPQRDFADIVLKDILDFDMLKVALEGGE